MRSTVATPAQSIPAALKRNGIDRLQLTTWALLRAQSVGVVGSQSLATSGSLGASQAGARLMYNFAKLRRRSAGAPTSDVAEEKSPAAFESSQSRGFRSGSIPLHFLLDGYLQGGVGIRQRDKSIDGGLTLTRPVYKQFAAGLSVWGGRSAGPLPRRCRATRHDAGSKEPARPLRLAPASSRQRSSRSGPAVTLAGDF